MSFRQYLQNLINAKTMRVEELRNSIKTAQTADEVRALGETLDAVLKELEDAKEQLEKLDDDGTGEGEGAGEGEGTGDGTGSEGQRGAQVNGQHRSFNPLVTYGLNNGQQKQRGTEVPYSSLEYRQAFKDYVQRGVPIPADVIQRAGGDPGTTTTAQLGMIIPTTIMNEFIQEVSKVYGQIYAKVRKLNVQGGVEFPIAKLQANFKWITETKASEKQEAGDITEKVSFSYHIGEIRVAETLLAQIVSLDIFESEITRIMVEAYVKAMDEAIISGTGSGQPLGITKDPRVTGNASNIIELTEEEMGEWTAWRKKLFAKVPLSKRGSGEFLFPSSTVETHLLTMQDANGRPLFKEATEGTVGNEAGSFFGRVVTLVEPDIIKDYDTASAGDIIGVFWVPTDYAINTQLQFGIKRYFDEDTNEWINKGLTIVDGKILDVSGCYLIKKKGAAK